MYQPAKKIQLTFFAKSKEICEKAVKGVAKRMQDEFLFEKSYDKKEGVATETKEEIISVLAKHDVRSFKGKSYSV